MWIKICGLKEPHQARAIAALRPDAIGLNFYPHPQVVLKADYQHYTDKELSRWDLGLGYMF